MVTRHSPELSTVFGALADSTRRAIVARLLEGPATVSTLAEPFDVSLPAISKHLAVLERAGLIRRKRVGRTFRCELRPDPLVDAAEWLEVYRRFWERQLDSLVRYIDPNSGKEES